MNTTISHLSVLHSVGSKKSLGIQEEAASAFSEKFGDHVSVLRGILFALAAQALLVAGVVMLWKFFVSSH